VAAGVLEVLHGCVGTGEEEPFVAVVLPADAEWGPTVLAADLEDLGVTVGLTDVVSLDDQTISSGCTHGSLLWIGSSQPTPIADAWPGSKVPRASRFLIGVWAEIPQDAAVAVIRNEDLQHEHHAGHEDRVRTGATGHL